MLPLPGPSQPMAHAAAPTLPVLPVHVVNHGWHTGLIVPADSLNRKLPELAHHFGQPAFYEIGWGDQGFYQAPKVTLGLALRALLGSSGTVVHVAAVPIAPHITFPRSARVTSCLTEVELERLLDFVAHSFQRDATGQHLRPLAAGLYGHAQFYAGVGHYHILNTCNRWTAQALERAGHPLPPFWLSLTAGTVMQHLAQQRRACPQSAPAAPAQPTWP